MIFIANSTKPNKLNNYYFKGKINNNVIMNPFTEAKDDAIKFIQILNQPMYMKYLKENKNSNKSGLAYKISECGKLASDILWYHRKCESTKINEECKLNAECNIRRGYGLCPTAFPKGEQKDKETKNHCNITPEYIYKVKKMYYECNRATTDVFFGGFDNKEKN
jgi:hypothetical protein